MSFSGQVHSSDDETVMWNWYGINEGSIIFENPAPFELEIAFNFQCINPVSQKSRLLIISPSDGLIYVHFLTNTKRQDFEKMDYTPPERLTILITMYFLCTYIPGFAPDFFGPNAQLGLKREEVEAARLKAAEWSEVSENDYLF